MQETKGKVTNSSEKILTPSYPYQEGPEHGLLSNFEPGVRTLPSGYRPDPQFAPLTCEVVMEKDITITLRDGTIIYADVFKPVGVEKVPLIVAWSPYGKSGGTSQRVTSLFQMLGLSSEVGSALERVRRAGPCLLVRTGARVCNPDARGVAHSGGDSVMFGRQKGQDCYDLIE